MNISLSRRFLLLAACALACAAGVASAQTWDAGIAPKATDNFTEAKFRLRIDDPPGGRIKGLLVLAPGWNGDGRGLVNDPDWRRFAQKAGFGLVGVCLRSDEHSDVVYHQADRGSGEAFRRALVALAAESRHPEVADAPLLVWGHSAGGQFAYGLACVMPERMIAFAAVKGGIYETRFNPLAVNIPGIFIIGEKDEDFRKIGITQVFESGRQSGAVWCVAWEPGAGHEIGRSRDVIEPFFQDVLTQRMTPDGKPRPVAASQGWLGVRSSLRLLSPGSHDAAGNPLATVWLPGERAAKAWAAFER